MGECVRAYVSKIRLYFIAALLDGMIAGFSALGGSFVEMMSSGKSSVHEVSGLVWAACALAFGIGFAKTARSYVSRVTDGDGA